MSRQAVLDALRQHPDVSVLIIGAGVNGIGVFRDLALQGVDVLMVDRGDYCSGASAASSHMMHGGLRYLENGEFRLVHEALVERNRLLRNAPHYVKPLSITFPIFSRFSGLLNAPLKFLGLRDKPSERGWLVIKLGLLLYDFLAREYRTMPTHRFDSREKALARRPAFSPEVLATASYYDAWMPYPERICLELIFDAQADCDQARALNCVSVVGGAGDQVTLRDELTGETFAVRPKVVVNAAGPWIDLANRAIKRDTRYIGGTKGSHLILDCPELYQACDGDQIFFENRDGRIVLIFPFLGKVMVGTTDIRQDDPDAARCTDDEVEYILDLIKVVFPSIHVDRSHIVFWFCGVRPLPRSDVTRTGAISRDHSIQVIEANGEIHFPVFSLVGGKWTTFRAFAEQTTNQVLERLGRQRTRSTADLPIGGGKGFPKTDAEQRRWAENLTAQTGLSVDRALVLLERYGTYASRVADFCAAGDDAPLVHAPDYSRREVIFIAQHEQVVHLDDFILRRTLLGMLGQVDGALLTEVGAVIGGALNWSEAQRRQEIERAAQILIRHHGVKPEKLQAALEGQQ